jgi:formylmethanofuran dehydrogenase subunit E
MSDIYDWKNYLDKAKAYHGHLCSGQILGLRMALAGMRKLGLLPGEEHRDLVIFLESDRCMGDAAYVATGVTFGRRRVKLKDFGKTAMSFLDLNTGRAYRVSAYSSPRPEPGHKDLVSFWSAYQDNQIFKIEEISIELKPEDMPGHPGSSAICQSCGEDILDKREVTKDGKILCQSCAGQRYYLSLSDGR